MTTTHTDLVRSSAAAAAVVLAVLSLGDALVLAVVLVVAAWRLPALAVVPALLASSWRWGSTSLEALAGAQAVLGPAGLVGPGTAAAASWLAGFAILLAIPGLAPRPRVGGITDPGGDPHAPNPRLGSNLLRAGPLLVALATGVTVAAVVVGPGPGGNVWARGGVSVVASLGAAGVAILRSRGSRVGRALDGAAVVAGVSALVAASRSAPGWSGTVEGGDLRTGVLVAVAVVAATTVGARAMTAMWDRRA